MSDGPPPDDEPEEGSKPTPRDHPRGYTGWVYEDTFKDLYQPPAAESPVDGEEGDADGPDGAEKDAAPAVPGHDDGEIDLSREDEEIKAIKANAAAEEERIERLKAHLAAKKDEARDLDRKDAEFLQQRWGLVMREQVPVPESKLKRMLDHDELDEEGLVIPRRMMEDMERYYEIKKGAIPHHDNLLAISKPEEPNHFKQTKSVQLRAEVMNVKPTLTEDQKAQITTELEERNRKRPRMPAGLNAEEKAKNRDIVKRMQMKVNFLKNPRFLADRTSKEKGEPCPFWFTPENVVFRNYEIGGLYEIKVEFRNCTGIGRRLRVHPCESSAFSISQLRFDKEVNSQRPDLVGNDPLAAVVAPGMAAHLTVHFAPSTLNDENQVLKVLTELGDFELPLLARRVQPKIEVQDPVNCGCMLAGEEMTEAVRIRNVGGEGSFRLVVSEDEPPEEFHYESRPNTETTLVAGPYRLTPACFYLEANSHIDISVHFSAREVGKHRCPLFVECDNGERIPLTLVAVSDAVRLELSRWPTLSQPLVPRRADPGTSVWNQIPWQLNWSQPGTQVGHKSMQSIEISNGGYLPMQVEWRLAAPPQGLLSRLSVGTQNRLTEDMLANVSDWTLCPAKSYLTSACPFKVEPPSMTIPPFSTAQFSFTFQAHPPVGTASTVFAYLVANNLPDSRECLLNYNKLLELQGPMQPEEYRKGLPLFGGSCSKAFDRKLRKNGSTAEIDLKAADPSECCISRAITTVCLKGVTVKPTVNVLPRVIALNGDVLPFTAQTREIKLRNTGPQPSYFRVRLTSTVHAADANSIDPLWVVSVPEVGPRPQEPESDPNPADPVLEEMRMTAERLARQWPPLPPEEGAEGAALMPGYGALASVAVEPHEGRIPPGGVVTIRVTLRGVRECDLDGQLVIDLPVAEGASEPAAPSIKVGVIAALRSPRAELRNTPFLDYGVVRAHSRQTLRVQLDNPTSLPMLVRLRHHKQEGQDDFFPVASHREVVNMYLSAVNSGSTAGWAPVEAEERKEIPVEPWVHSKSGCLDKSGRRKYGFKGRGSHPDEADQTGGFTSATVGIPDSEDFIFNPGFLALWPHSSAEVEVTLRTKEVGKFNAILEAVGFNSLNVQCLEVLAEVQLPQVRLNTQHAHFPVTYLRTASHPMQVELRNDSDMTANFSWDVPLKMEACLECQIDPAKGSIPPRGSIKATIITVPTREDDSGDAVLPCNLYVEEILQPLELRVTAVVYGCEVDYAVVPPGQLPPEIVHVPRKKGDSPCDPAGTYQITTGTAARSFPKVDFGEMELQKAKVLQVVLYNRSGIATPFGVRIEKNPAFDPLVKGRKIGDLLDAATRMYAMINKSGGDGGDGDSKRPDTAQTQDARQTFESSPQPAGGGRDLNAEANMESTQRPSSQASRRKSRLSMSMTGKKRGSMVGKKRRWLLDDKHERQAFRSSIGADFAKQKELREAGKVALKAGRGFAVKINPTSDWLQPFSSAVITLTCFSDLPGLMEDELVLTVRESRGHSEGKDFRIPVRLLTHGNPLYLPDQQVGLNIQSSPPRLLCGVTVPAEKQLMRRFKVGNNSSTKVHITWMVYPKAQLENAAEDRQMVKVALTASHKDVKDPFVEKPKAKAEKDPLGLDIEEVELQDDDDEDPDPAEPFNFKIWTQDPPEIEDPFAVSEGQLPVQIEPREAIVPEHGTATFAVTMTCLKATITAANNYRYTLVGKCRFTKDREARLAFAEENPDGEYNERGPQTVYTATSANSAVANLPDIKMSSEELLDDDSDLEDQKPKFSKEGRSDEAKVEEVQRSTDTDGQSSGKKKASRAQPHGPEPLAVEPDLDVLSTIVVDCIGDCILPRLTVDKKGNPHVEEFAPQNAELDKIGDFVEPTPVVNAPVFKFTWASVPPAGAKKAGQGTGAVHGGLPGMAQIPGIASCLVRQVTLSNHNASNVTCRFKTDGPYRIRQIQQVGHHPVELVSDEKGSKKKARESQNSELARQLFTIAKWETITLQVEFMPDWIPLAEWEHSATKNEHRFEGDLIVEYPRETSNKVLTTHKDDLQRIHLVGTARRPAVRVHVVPALNPSLDQAIKLERFDKPPWSEPQPVLVEFGYTHVSSSVTRSRVILLANVSNILARWSLMHVGRKRRPPHIIGSTLQEEEDFRALDDKDAFEFDISAGDLPGPSKDGLMPGSEERLPHWCAKSAAVPHGLPFADEHRYEPQKIKISFKPKKNELYKCRFRVQVENGLSIDFVCRGCGSYDEEDDNVDFHEA
eukprot:gb/GFBE01033071.1/.p1 GENE.gb/GFBE01033071.1/~~gb/GFBE01033071.1/.p1  ORF type:complete len:2256 (+),score=522.78 gb/GFBE01033071.1/:1-6768(+)